MGRLVVKAYDLNSADSQPYGIGTKKMRDGM